MQYGTQQTSTTPRNDTPFPLSTDEPGVSLNDLLHHTGFSIKIRFLLALTLIAILPSVILVLLLGDPTGSEQQATMGNALFIQAQAQAQAINQVLAERQQSITNLAQTGLASRVDALQTAQDSDPAALAWLVVDNNGFIFAAGDRQQTLAARTLTTINLVSSPASLLQFVQSTANATGNAPQVPITGYDTARKQVWIAFAAQIPATPNRVLLAVFALPKLLGNMMAQASNVSGSTSILLDQKARIAAATGTLLAGHIPLASAPADLNGVRLNTATPTMVSNDALTGHTDLAVGLNVPVLNGEYLVLVEHTTPLIANNRSIFSGRNTPLLLLGIFVLVVLVATWIALPIIRPIRRATRVIETTTEDVRKLARDAKVIAEDHMMGTTILSGASKRLSGRRLVLIRDTTLIARICQDALPRLQLLLRRLQETRDVQAIDELGAIYQGYQQIHATAAAIAESVGKDVSLDQLDQAMVGAREIARQFEATGKQLEEETTLLETAAQSLI